MKRVKIIILKGNNEKRIKIKEFPLRKVIKIIDNQSINPNILKNIQKKIKKNIKKI